MPEPKQPCVECPAATMSPGPSLGPAWRLHQQKQADFLGEVLLANNAEPPTIIGYLSSYSMWVWESGAAERGAENPRVD